MSSLRLAHFYPWEGIPGEFIKYPLAAFAEHGAECLTFTQHQCLRMLRHPGYENWFFEQAQAYGIKVMDAHGLCFQIYDLDTDDREQREKSIKDHIDVITRLSDLGLRTYTVHIGAALYVFPPFLDLPQLRANALHSLENILPVAEKCGMKIALENSFEPPNAPDELLWYIEQFNSPALLCCFDSGHANYMKKGSKDLSKFSAYHRDSAWRGDLRLEDKALDKMAPYIVTCHLHDNSGYNDDHVLPGKGTIDWKELISGLKKCPNIQSMQNETSVLRDRQTVKQMCEIFSELMKY